MKLWVTRRASTVGLKPWGTPWRPWPPAYSGPLSVWKPTSSSATPQATRWAMTRSAKTQARAALRSWA